MTDDTKNNPVIGNLHQIRRRIKNAALRAGRDPADITLVAVSKAQPIEKIPAAYSAGQRVFGENYVQEMLGKQDELDATDIQWHFIGGLQSNKIRQIVGRVHLIHSIDRVKLAREVGKRSQQAGIVTDILIQINVGDEATKGGITPENAQEQFAQILQVPGIRVTGLMAVPPFLDPEDVRPYFVQLRQLRDRLVTLHGHPLPHLSMGMSGDFEAAIEEGATLVRVGSSIFGARVYH